MDDYPKMEPLVSVIVPIYNVEKYLETCIDSILMQNYKNLEVLLIDDGSTDNSGKYCDEIQKKDCRITVYHKENGGLSDARNYGIEKANGDFFAFIDSDDVLHKDFIFQLMKAQRETNAEIVACDMSLFYDKAELEQLFKLKCQAHRTLFTGSEILKEYFYPEGERNGQGKRILYHGLCMKIYRRELFNKYRFEKNKLHEDVYITHLLLRECRKVVYIDCPYYFYYQNNSGSICNNFGVKNFIDEADAYRQIYEIYKNNNGIIEEVMHFLISQYLLLLEKGYNIKDKSKIMCSYKQIKYWILKNVGKCSYYRFPKRVLVYISVYNIRIYSFMRKMSGK